MILDVDLEPDGNGPTLELIHPDSLNENASAWGFSSGNGSPGSLNSIAEELFISDNNIPSPALIASTVRRLQCRASAVTTFPFSAIRPSASIAASSNEDTKQQIHICNCRHTSTHSSFYCVSRASRTSKAESQILSKA